MLVIFNLLETPPAWGLQVMQQLNIFIQHSQVKCSFLASHKPFLKLYFTDNVFYNTLHKVPIYFIYRNRNQAHAYWNTKRNFILCIYNSKFLWTSHGIKFIPFFSESCELFFWQLNSIPMVMLLLCRWGLCVVANWATNMSYVRKHLCVLYDNICDCKKCIKWLTGEDFHAVHPGVPLHSLHGTHRHHRFVPPIHIPLTGGFFFSNTFLMGAFGAVYR
jgi:hypothetical protein